MGSQQSVASGDTNMAEKNIPDEAIDVSPINSAGDSSPIRNPMEEPEKCSEVLGPVSLEHFHTRSKDVFPLTFEGVKFVTQKLFSQHFQTSHSVSLSSKEAGYRFGATFAGTVRSPEGDSFPVLMGEVTPSGDLHAQFLHQIAPYWRVRYMTQMSPERVVQHQFSQEWRLGPRWLAGCAVANPSPDLSRYIVILDAACQLTERACIANQFLLQSSPVVAGNLVGSWSVGLRLNSSHKVPLLPGPCGAGARAQRLKEQSKWQVAISGSPLSASLQATVAMRVTPQLQVATELEIVRRQQTAVASIGYQYDLDQTGTTLKSQVDSQLNVLTTVERRLTHLPFLFTFSARVNPRNNKCVLGIGLSTE